MKRIMAKLLHWWIGRHYGARCPGFHVDCPCCTAWLMYDWLFSVDYCTPSISLDLNLGGGVTITVNDANL